MTLPEQSDSPTWVVVAMREKDYERIEDAVTELEGLDLESWSLTRSMTQREAHDIVAKTWSS